MRADSFKIFINKIVAFPLWVKQIIYYHLKKDLKNVFVNQPINADPETLFQAYVPTITFVGKKELNERAHMHEEVMYTFLKACADKKSIIDITLDCFFSLEEVSKLFIDALKQEYLMPPESKVIMGTAEFFAGQIKTGEYLYRIGRLTVDQLDAAIRQQQKMESEGQNVRMAELISGMGFIEQDEIISILIMKQEAKKRFIFNMDVNSIDAANSDVIELKKQIEKLSYENNYLKTKLKTILKMGN